MCSASPAIARVYHASREQRRAVQGIGSFQRNCLMATLTTGVVSACWFAMGLLGITMADITAIWHNIESVMIEEMNQTPPQWPMILT
ncbi:hypothetical protein BKD50_004230 [Escherichia coli]|nr:hypothetical protein [Escherichia coli]